MKMTNNQNSFKTFLSLPRVTDKYLKNPILWFSELTKAQFKEWFCFSLAHESIYPFHSSINSRFGVEIQKNIKKLIYAFRQDPALPNFESYIISSVREIFIEWSIERENISESLRRFQILVKLVGIFKLSVEDKHKLSVEDKLCKILNSELKRYRNKGVDTEIDNAMVMALKVLSAIGNTNSSINVLKHYILDEKYAALCYRALYKRDPNYAREYFDHTFDMYKKKKSTMDDIFERLERFITPDGTMKVIQQAIIKHSERKRIISIDRPWILRLKGFLRLTKYNLDIIDEQYIPDIQIVVLHDSANSPIKINIPKDLCNYDSSYENAEIMFGSLDNIVSKENESRVLA